MFLGVSSNVSLIGGGKYYLSLFSCSWMRTSLRGPEFPQLLRGEAPRKSGPGGIKDAREYIGPPTRGRRLRLLNASVISTLLYGYEAWKLSAQAPAQAKRDIVKDFIQNYRTYYHRRDRKPPLHIVMQARDSPWNWLHRILRLEEDQVIRLDLMNCVKPSPESSFGDVPDLDSRKAAELAESREKWKCSGLQSVANLFTGDMQ